MKTIAICLLWLASLFIPAHGLLAACRVEQRTVIAIKQVGGLLMLPLTVNGVVENFLLDTGAERSVIGIAAADRLHLARDEWVSTDIQGAGGRDRRRLGRPSSLALGGIALYRHTVAGDNSLVVGPIPEQVSGSSIAGLLGQDFLSPFDIDIDIPAGKLTLYKVTGCAGRFLPWQGAYMAIAAWRPVGNVLALPIRIGATALQAELDSGAASTVVTLPGMVQMGLASGGADTVRGFGKGSLAARTQHFASVQVGATPAFAADLVIAPLPTLHSIGALLGADWLASHHVWVSWATDQVFVAGGGA